MPNMKLLTPTEAARYLGVSPITLRKWSEKGLIQSLTTLGGHRRYPINEVERLRQGQEKTRPSTMQILIVDDDKFLPIILQEFLVNLNMPVVVQIAHDGFDAGRKLIDFKPDIILLDLMMPGMDGFEVCRRIKSDPATSMIRVVAMTSYHSNENIEKILSIGAEACLAKPVEHSELLDVINRPALVRNQE